MDNRTYVTPTVASDVATVYASIELSRKSWLVAVQSARQGRASRHKLEAGDAAGLCRVLERERARLERSGSGTARMVTCYEAGRDGFWLHRTLVSHGAESYVVDPASIEVNRRARRAKSDKLDVESQLRMLIGYDAGERHRCRMVAVPSVAEEDARRPGRERQRLVGERTAQSNRISGLLALHGIYGYRPLRADRWERLAELRCADGQELPELLHEEIVRALTRLEFVQGQIKAVEKQRAGKLAHEDRGARYTRALMRFHGIGIEIASVLAREVYYRDFANRRQVGSYVGLCASPYQSGDTNHEQGISKAGNRLARHKAIELAWLWLQHQPQSALSRWFYARLGTSQSKRFKRVLAVALARKLVVALWRYLSADVVPEGARLEPCYEAPGRRLGMDV